MPFAFPVVAKLVSPDLPHKTDAGAIKVGIADKDELTAAIEEMRASAERYHPGFRLTGILVQELAKGLGEALIGLSRDPVAGPVVTVAMGGVMTEIYRDSAVRPAPVSVEEARKMIREVKGFELMRGFRGRPKGDLEALASAVSALSRLAGHARIEEAEANPVLVGEEGAGVVMLDALIRT
jgi:succinyl-CoA synthetase beta subunit